MRYGSALVFALVGAGLLLLTRTASASIAPDLQPADPLPPADPGPSADPLAAFLFAIQACETGLNAARSGASYTTFYGGSQFSDLSNHPVLTGEKSGVPLSDRVCAAAGYGPGCVSTAAGAYQINLPTWREFGADLPDFSPASQDEAARRIVERTGALDALLNGDVETAFALASSRWASLPGSRAGQSPKSMNYALAAYETGLEMQA